MWKKWTTSKIGHTRTSLRMCITRSVIANVKQTHILSLPGCHQFDLTVFALDTRYANCYSYISIYVQHKKKVEIKTTGCKG